MRRRWGKGSRKRSRPDVRESLTSHQNLIRAFRCMGILIPTFPRESASARVSFWLASHLCAHDTTPTDSQAMARLQQLGAALLILLVRPPLSRPRPVPKPKDAPVCYSKQNIQNSAVLAIIFSSPHIPNRREREHTSQPCHFGSTIMVLFSHPRRPVPPLTLLVRSRPPRPEAGVFWLFQINIQTRVAFDYLIRQLARRQPSRAHLASSLPVGLHVSSACRVSGPSRSAPLLAASRGRDRGRRDAHRSGRAPAVFLSNPAGRRCLQRQRRASWRPGRSARPRRPGARGARGGGGGPVVPRRGGGVPLGVRGPHQGARGRG